MAVELYRPRFINGRYENPEEWSSDDNVAKGYSRWKIPNKSEFVQMKLGKDVDRSNIPCKHDLDKTLPVNKEDVKKLESIPKDGIQIMWIGHASMVVQFDGLTILTDPIFSHRCSPVQMKGVGCPRYREVPCTVTDLPKIDAVLISHDHYDHLDYDSVKELNKRFGDTLHWFVPIGLKSWFQSKSLLGLRGIDCKNVTELTWWEYTTVQPKTDDRTETFTFICTPAQHWCQRGLNDLNKRGLNDLNKVFTFITLYGVFTCICTPAQHLCQRGLNDLNKVFTCITFYGVFTCICTPAQHLCQRGLNDLNKSLWCSWVVKSSRHKFFFAGDTGYCPAFKQIGEQHGPFHLAAIPIGAYEPRWFMSPQHVSPEQAVDIFVDINKLHRPQHQSTEKNTSAVSDNEDAEKTGVSGTFEDGLKESQQSMAESVQRLKFEPKFIGIHWGTFKQLGCYEPYLEPPLLVLRKIEELGIPLSCFPECPHGNVRLLNFATL
ncbi:hypothetical protein KUTeg_023525 [Tegillarca granosa]|uniref:N-acetylphosphatidylethanolamine-hydrolyzing phospholipase D n=1 Tax=Tegillarca granosa TaxID=220873 RepID=A0ABQ9E2V8_TEGGR|nr:hypothetical protein KUTeg_023525 [Tegillarca granosa]